MYDNYFILLLFNTSLSSHKALSKISKHKTHIYNIFINLQVPI